MRETLFSMLLSRIGSFDGLAVADLFAGSGALGLEALSRGAVSCLFVDTDASAIAAVRANAARLGAENRAEVRQGSAERVASSSAFDLLFLDPPYGSGLAQQALGHLLHRDGVAERAWVAIETRRGEAACAAGFDTVAERDIGKAHLTLLRRH